MDNPVMKPIGFVRNDRRAAIDDAWACIGSTIELTDDFPAECLDGIEDFSHLEILYFFHEAGEEIKACGHPRGNTDFPKVGIFAQRKKDRPNHIGATIVNLVKREGKQIIVRNLDAIDGTPVLDIKPVFKEFLPQGEIRQPAWAKELMKNYW